MTPTLAEIEARHAATEEWITKPMSSVVNVAFAARLHEDRAALLALVRERDARLAEIATMTSAKLLPPSMRTADRQRIHALATKETS